MLVVSDNSPLNILIRTGTTRVLPLLFGGIVVPPQVAEEMRHRAAPEPIRQFIQSPPAWFSIVAVDRLLPLPQLDAGEAAAISLAVQLHADALLMDERLGREAARREGLQVVGAIGILELASDRGLIDDLKAIHDVIRHTDFHVSSHLLDESLARHRATRHDTGIDGGIAEL